MPGFRVALASGRSPFGGNLDCSLATSALSTWNEVSGLQTEEVGQLDKWLPYWSDPTSPFPYYGFVGGAGSGELAGSLIVNKLAGMMPRRGLSLFWPQRIFCRAQTIALRALEGLYEFDGIAWITRAELG